MREDQFTNTPEDAAAYERARAADDVDDRPTLAELERDDADCTCWWTASPACERCREDDEDDDVDWNVAASEHLPARPGDTS